MAAALQTSKTTDQRDDASQSAAASGGGRPDATGEATQPSHPSQPKSPTFPRSPTLPTNLLRAFRRESNTGANKTERDGGGELGTEEDVPNPNIDPLSQHIILRRNTEHAVPHRLRASRPDSPMAESFPRSSTDLAKTLLAPVDHLGKEKRKSSFLSRLSMRGKKKDGDDDSGSEMGGESRTDGVNALVFSQAVAAPGAGGGYIPHHKEPPKYIRTRAQNKKQREFTRVFLAQELVGTKPPPMPDGTEKPGATVAVANNKATQTGGAIWAAEFSKDGKYLAAAGRDHVVRVWAVLSTPEERRAHQDEEDANGGAGGRLSAPVFRNQPVMTFEGHTGEVLDLSWSKNNFLLSSSMDKTVRLWHMSRTECLCTFKHKDFVTKLAFHPRDDRFFLAGSLDTMLRLWSIPEKAVAYSAQLPDLVTAVAFSPDGTTAMAGLLNGLCLFYETDGLKFNTQIHVRSSRGKNAKGSKITGIQTMAVASVPTKSWPTSPTRPQRGTDEGDVKVLVSSNDSRIRIYDLRDKTLDVKLKGHDNTCSQISATFSDDAKYVICGSEDRKAYIWNPYGAENAGDNKEKAPCEYFEAHSDMVTTALFAPTLSRMLLDASGDPLFDLCNPPPVTLRSLGETADTGQTETADAGPETSSTEKTPAYLERSKHPDGHIIVTTDHSGIIKVFRQDCAYTKRRTDKWETGSTFSRHKVGTGYVGGRAPLIRTGSVVSARRSTSSPVQSRRGSLGHQQQVAAVSLPPGVTLPPGTSDGSPDRIISWRQGIEGGADKRASSIMSGAINGGTPERRERSVSPPRVPTADTVPEETSVESEPVREDVVGLPEPGFTFKPSGDDDAQQQNHQQRPDPGSGYGSFFGLGRLRGIVGFGGQRAPEADAHGKHDEVRDEREKEKERDRPNGHTRRKSLGAAIRKGREDGAGNGRKADRDRGVGAKPPPLPPSALRSEIHADAETVPRGS